MNKLMLILVILLTACSKDELIPLNRDYWGEINIKKNNDMWNPYIIGLLANKPFGDVYGLEIASYDNQNILRKELNIFGIPLNKMGKFEINTTNNQKVIIEGNIAASYGTSIEDGDVNGDVYYLDTSANNFIEITNIYGNEIKGNFQIRLLRDTSRIKYLENSDTILFKDVTFHTRIIKP
jgi:hypothetical protein